MDYKTLTMMTEEGQLSDIGIPLGEQATGSHSCSDVIYFFSDMSFRDSFWRLSHAPRTYAVVDYPTLRELLTCHVFYMRAKPQA